MSAWLRAWWRRHVIDDEPSQGPDMVEEAYTQNGDTLGFERSTWLPERPRVVAGTDIDAAKWAGLIADNPWLARLDGTRWPA